VTAAVLLNGCSNAATGSVRGVFDGRAKSSPHSHSQIIVVPSAGRIVLSSPRGTYRTTAATDGKFALNVPPGNYRITGSPGLTPGLISAALLGCTGSVRVKGDQVIHTVVTCVFH